MCVLGPWGGCLRNFLASLLADGLLAGGPERSTPLSAALRSLPLFTPSPHQPCLLAGVHRRSHHRHSPGQWHGKQRPAGGSNAELRMGHGENWHALQSGQQQLWMGGFERSQHSTSLSTDIRSLGVLSTKRWRTWRAGSWASLQAACRCPQLCMDRAGELSVLCTRSAHVPLLRG